MSSSVTPPNNTLIPFAAQRAIVHPLRKEGAYASDGLLRFSHLKVGPDSVGFADILVVDFRLDVGVGGGASDGSVILVFFFFYKQKKCKLAEGRTNFSIHVSSSITPTGRFPLRYSLQYPPGFHGENIGQRLELLNLPCKTMPSAYGRNENPLRGLAQSCKFLKEEKKKN